MSAGPANAPGPVTPARPLFDYRSVAIGTFFGSPLAGGILMAITYRRLGQKRAAALIALAGVVLTTLILLLAFNDSSNWMKGLPIGLMLAIMYTAKWLQGEAVDRHVQNGGTLASRWAAFGIGMASLVVVIGVVVGIVVLQMPPTPHRRAIGKNDEVLFSEKATEKDARALGAALKADGYMQDRGVSVLLKKDDTGFTVSFVLKAGSWNDPQNVAAFEQVGREVAPSLGGLPLKVHLVDNSLAVHKDLTVR